MNKLIGDSSIQEALRKHFPPIKNDDPRLDFYTTYKRETTEYDNVYMEKYNEDLSNTLIFVRFFGDSVAMQSLTTFSGRSILRGHRRLRHRHPIKSRARLQRAVGSVPPSDSPQHQQYHFSARGSRCSSTLEWSAPRDRHDLGPVVCKPTHVAIGRIRRNAGQAVGEKIPPSRWWIHS